MAEEALRMHFEQECADVDKLLTRLGLDPERCRSEGGRLLVGRAVSMIQDRAVDRFLSWRLPKDFMPDCGISFKPIDHPACWPSGTNLLHAGQARAMLEHVLGQTQSSGDTSHG